MLRRTPHHDRREQSLVKHLSMGESKYLGQVFGRPFPEHMPWWDEDAEDNADKLGHRKRVPLRCHRAVPAGVRALGQHHQRSAAILPKVARERWEHDRMSERSLSFGAVVFALQWPGSEPSRSDLFTDIRQIMIERRVATSAAEYVGHLSTHLRPT